METKCNNGVTGPVADNLACRAVVATNALAIRPEWASLVGLRPPVGLVATEVTSQRQRCAGYVEDSKDRSDNAEPD